jgi:hypothetical protein
MKKTINTKNEVRKELSKIYLLDTFGAYVGYDMNTFDYTLLQASMIMIKQMVAFDFITDEFMTEEEVVEIITNNYSIDFDNMLIACEPYSGLYEWVYFHFLNTIDYIKCEIAPKYELYEACSNLDKLITFLENTYYHHCNKEIYFELVESIYKG